MLRPDVTAGAKPRGVAQGAWLDAQEGVIAFLGEPLVIEACPALRAEVAAKSPIVSRPDEVRWFDAC